MNKKLTGIVAGAAGAALLLTGGTYALWNDSAEAPGGTITAGNLEVAAVGEAAWTDQSADRTDQGHVIDLTAFKIVPGDTIAGSFGFDLGLQGDNMVASLSVTGQGLTGDLADGLEATYTVKQGTTVIGTSTGDLSTGVAVQLASADNANNAAGLPTVDTALDGTADLTLEVTVTFDPATSNRDLTQLTAALAGASATLEQVRTAAPGFN